MVKTGTTVVRPPVTTGAVGVSSIADRRLLRGSRSRQLVLALAVDIASLQGLEQLSFGRLATASGLSKAGVQGLFPSKEALQLATIEHARERFFDFVIRPALGEQHGEARLRMLIERWIDYAERPLFAGGCFQAANLTEFDSHPGPVRDALAQVQHNWTEMLAAELRRAIGQGDIAELDPALVAFQIDAILRTANTSLRLGDYTVSEKVRQVIDGFLTSPRANQLGRTDGRSG
jgi:AcrR family transcriptional regulator